MIAKMCGAFYVFLYFVISSAISSYLLTFENGVVCNLGKFSRYSYSGTAVAYDEVQLLLRLSDPDNLDTLFWREPILMQDQNMVQKTRDLKELLVLRLFPVMSTNFSEGQNYSSDEKYNLF